MDIPRRVAQSAFMTNTLVLLLCAVLAQPALAQTKTAQNSIEKQAAKIPAGERVVVGLKNGQPLKGQMGDVSAAGFSVKVWSTRGPETREVRFDEVESIKKQGRSEAAVFVRRIFVIASTVATAVAVSRAVAR